MPSFNHLCLWEEVEEKELEGNRLLTFQKINAQNSNSEKPDVICLFYKSFTSIPASRSSSQSFRQKTCKHPSLP